MGGVMFAECTTKGTRRYWKEMECDSAEYFDSNTKRCQPGACPTCTSAAPEYSKCNVYGSGHKFGHLYDCKKVGVVLAIHICSTQSPIYNYK